MKTLILHPLVLAPALVSGNVHATNPAPVAQYEFNGTFASTVAGAPALVPTDPLSLSGFAPETVLGTTRSVWNFAGEAKNVTSQAGLTLNTQGLITDASVYSVEIVFKFTQGADDWRRILDVSGRQSDSGFYVNPSNNLDVYPAAGGAAFRNDVFHDVFLVNNAGVVTFYLDGSAQASISTHVLDLDGAQTMSFFLDNLVGDGQGEYSSGSVALIRVYDEALSSPPAPVPEPTTLATLLAGLFVVAVACRRRDGSPLEQGPDAASAERYTAGL